MNKNETSSEMFNTLIDELVFYLNNTFKDYRRFYTPTDMNETISYTYSVAGITIQASHEYRYVDILGLTEEQQEQLERKLKRNE